MWTYMTFAFIWIRSAMFLEDFSPVPFHHIFPLHFWKPIPNHHPYPAIPHLLYLVNPLKRLFSKKIDFRHQTYWHHNIELLLLKYEKIKAFHFATYPHNILYRYFFTWSIESLSPFTLTMLLRCISLLPVYLMH